MLEFLNKNFPDVAKALNKSDDFAEAEKQLSKADNLKLTREQSEAIIEAFENAGLSDYLLKTSNSLELTGDTLNIPASVWNDGPCGRGDYIDEFLNHHSLDEGLGKNFPVVDRVEDGVLISTKSLDIGLPSYQKSNKLKRTLEKYAEELKTFEGKYMKESDEFTWGGVTLNKNKYDKMALEIVLPDIIITEDALKVLEEFKQTMENQGIEVWYKVTK